MSEAERARDDDAGGREDADGRQPTAESNAMVGALVAEFERLHAETLRLVALAAPGMLYRQPSTNRGAESFGEQVLRSAGAIEQTFGGVTANFWDDPFEWTLPETLPVPEAIAAYVEEVAATRRRGFGLFASDADLAKRVALPSGELCLIVTLLIETLARASHHLGQARGALAFFVDVPPRR